MSKYLGSLSKADFAIIGFGLVTAVIHLLLARPLLILNGLGYIALLAMLFLPLPRLVPLRPVIRWGLIGYTAVTIVLYFVTHRGGLWMEDGLGLMTKMVEIILILLLFWSQNNE
ncbi:hypothetical protein [Candidatus Leptofilum sp.]|uniref:hypothetical protein n=1 Tax=Candidatus Leptofilum sp. TaxID=3241576 RepID=UPI003B5CDADA